MFHYDDTPRPQGDEDETNYGGWRSGLRWHDGETAPLGGGPMGPEPTPPTNPND